MFSCYLIYRKYIDNNRKLRLSYFFQYKKKKRKSIVVSILTSFQIVTTISKILFVEVHQKKGIKK